MEVPANMFEFKDLELGHLWKGASTQDLPGQRPSASESVPGFKFPLCPGPWVGRSEGETLCFQAQQEIKVLSPAQAWAARLVVLVCCL